VPHPAPLIEGRLVARYDRFIAEVRLADGRRARCHCVNPGRMEGLIRPGARVWISRAPPSRRRKLRYTWELVELLDGRVVGANTLAPNRLAGALLAARALPGFRAARVRPSPEGYRVEAELGVDLRPYPIAPRAAWRHLRSPLSGWTRSPTGGAAS